MKIKEKMKFEVGQILNGEIVFHVTKSYALFACTERCPTGKWADDTRSVGGTKASIGAGQANTKLIISNAVNPIASWTDNLIFHGHGNYYMPSHKELLLLRDVVRKYELQAYFNQTYWSSTQSLMNSECAMALSFYNNINGGFTKNSNPLQTIAIRKQSL